MRVVAALGGNALQKRGEAMTVENQRENVMIACEALAPVAMTDQLVISHGNGPQVGLLSLQASSYDETSSYPFDVLGAQTEGMIGYFIEQELGNLLPYEKPIATILTMTEVDPDDPAMKNPTKFVGPVYPEADAKRLASEKGWVVKQDGDMWRRVVPSPVPKHIFEISAIKCLLDFGAVVVCTGGGGIPTMYLPDEQLSSPTDQNPRTLVGVEAVIDKDRSSAVLAQDLEADLLVIATDADGVYVDWGMPQQKAIKASSPDDIDAFQFPAGSMGPKVEAASAFARNCPGKSAVIGALGDLPEIIAGTKGTRINTAIKEITYH
ncbi:MAG: carbamate kinase [Candidatus Nanopelagicales bacterium]|nr:carbamate kinase [Candidatus Nanopelagicales bacterium]MDZ4248554.1 carbamate kinase [Candidatus Nanopelagicales bacterium]